MQVAKDKKGEDVKMELTKNIFFNTDKLIENSKVKISYTGKFYQEKCEKVIMHYGFGEQWENVQDVEMENTELGFQTEIDLLEGTTFSFCFKNERDEWDNNNGKNYVFPLEKISQDLIMLENESKQLGAAKHLKRSYLWSKKIKLAVYKIITYLPKIISGNYRKKVNNEN